MSDDLEALKTALRTLTSRSSVDQLDKLLGYQEAFFSLVGWKAGDYAVLTKDLNKREGSAWKGLPYLVQGSVGKIIRVDWNSYSKCVSLLWEPIVEASTALRSEKRYESESERGSIKRLYPGYERKHPNVATLATMQERINGFAAGVRGDGLGGHMPFTVMVPDNPHCYSLFLADVEHATDDDAARAEGVKVQCLHCGLESLYSELIVSVYDHKITSGRRAPLPGETVSLPYKQCPACEEEKGLIILNPPWPMEREVPVVIPWAQQLWEARQAVDINFPIGTFPFDRIELRFLQWCGTIPPFMGMTTFRLAWYKSGHDSNGRPGEVDGPVCWYVSAFAGESVWIVDLHNDRTACPGDARNYAFNPIAGEKLNSIMREELARGKL